MARRTKLDPHTKDARDPLELLARMRVGSSFRVPAQGGGGGGLTSADVAGALGLMKDKLAKTVIVAVATQDGYRGSLKITKAAYRRVFRAVAERTTKETLDLHKPADRMRLRIALHNAAYELIYPEHHQSWAALAKAAKMRRSSYISIHKVCTSVLQEQMNNGRREFTWRLKSQGGRKRSHLVGEGESP
ncbi:MAG: hypothetical protein ACREO0_15085 [Pseudoxanthomonas sp.]